jgi:Immunity protein 49
MKKAPRQAVDLELVKEGVDGDRTLLARSLESAASRASALSFLLRTSCSLAGYLSVTDPESQELCRALRMGARAAAGIFALATGKGEVDLNLGEASVRLPATGPTDATHGGHWRVGWWLSHIVGDLTAIDRLIATPVDVLRRSSSRGDECQYLFIDALQAFEKRADDWATKLRVALDATDPTEVDLADEEFVLNIIVPEMQMLFRAAIGEVTPFNEALEFALERHNKYWGKASRKRDPNGYLALGPLAIARMARNAGMPIEVESEYLPKWLTEGGCKAQ